MATLPTEDREKVYRGLMRYWSRIWESMPLSKTELYDAVVATDVWIDDNQSAYNQSLPAAAQTNLSLAQKTLLFSAVAIARASITLLKMIFGGIN